jgi:hypothetical protein
VIAKSFLISSLFLFFSMAVQINGFAARPPRLPPEGFLEKGAWVLLGEVVEFQVLEQEGNSEYGNVVIRVDEVLEGRVNTALVNFPYRRQLGPGIINGTGWDRVIARPEAGKKFIIYFEEKDGVYSTPLWGGNPIQEISSFDDPKIEALRETVKLHRLPR